MFRPSTVAFLFPLLIAACGTTTVPSGERVGEPVQSLPVEKLATVQADPESYFEKTLLVEGRITAVCQKMGCWMNIEDGGQPTRVRWESGCGGKYSFPKDAVGERVLVQGSFYPKEITPEMAAHMQEEAGTDVAIPLKGYEMNASAVVLVDRK